MIKKANENKQEIIKKKKKHKTNKPKRIKTE